MIQCPYCGADMDDNARSCPKCLSMLVAETGRDAGTAYPVWRHPATALIVILLLSAGLLLASIKIAPASPKGKDNPAEKKAAAPPPGNVAAGPAPNPAGPPPPAPAPPTPNGEALSSEEFTAYETQITAIFTETDALTAEIDKLFNQKDDKAGDQLAGKAKQLQLQVQKLRRVDPPKVLNPVHSKLANALSMLSRGYQELARFQKSGDTTRLNKARKDIDTARQKRQDALNEVANFKATVKPPELAPAPPASDAKSPEPTPPPGPPPGAPPAVNPEDGTDTWGACIPKRLVEVYPTGKIRQRIIDGLKGQYNSTRLCGDAPGQPASDSATPPPGPQPQPPGPNGPEPAPPPTDNPEPTEVPPGSDQFPPQPEMPQPDAPQPEVPQP
jgi:hypothetical protein